MASDQSLEGFKARMAAKRAKANTGAAAHTESVIAAMEESKPITVVEPREEVPGVRYMCGIVESELQQWMITLPSAQQKHFCNVLKPQLVTFNKEFYVQHKRLLYLEERVRRYASKEVGADDAPADPILDAEFAKIDADTALSPDAKQQRKLKAVAAAIDPRLLKRSLEAGLRSGDSSARLLLANMFSAASPSKGVDNSTAGATILIEDDEDDE